MIRTIHFWGGLKDKLGIDSVRLDVNSPRDLVNGLRSQLPNFRGVLSQFPEMHVFLSNEDKTVIDPIGPDNFEFTFTAKAEHVHMVPAVHGAGAEMVAWLVMNAEMAYATAVAVTAIVTNLAISFAIGMISKALSSSPSTADGGSPTDQRPSFLYNGPVNVVEQGYAVPIVYGIHTTGSIVVSAGVDIVEIPYASAKDTAPDSGGDTQPDSPGTTTWQWEGGGADTGGSGGSDAPGE